MFPLFIEDLLIQGEMVQDGHKDPEISQNKNSSEKSKQFYTSAQLRSGALGSLAQERSLAQTEFTCGDDSLK